MTEEKETTSKDETKKGKKKADVPQRPVQSMQGEPMKTNPVTTLVEQNSIEAFCSHSSANVPIVGREKRSFQTSLTKTYLQGVWKRD